MKQIYFMIMILIIFSGCKIDEKPIIKERIKQLEANLTVDDRRYIVNEALTNYFGKTNYVDEVKFKSYAHKNYEISDLYTNQEIIDATEKIFYDSGHHEAFDKFYLEGIKYIFNSQKITVEKVFSTYKFEIILISIFLILVVSVIFYHMIKLLYFLFHKNEIERLSLAHRAKSVDDKYQEMLEIKEKYFEKNKIIGDIVIYEKKCDELKASLKASQDFINNTEKEKVKLRELIENEYFEEAVNLSNEHQNNKDEVQKAWKVYNHKNEILEKSKMITKKEVSRLIKHVEKINEESSHEDLVNLLTKLKKFNNIFHGVKGFTLI